MTGQAFSSQPNTLNSAMNTHTQLHVAQQSSNAAMLEDTPVAHRIPLTASLSLLAVDRKDLVVFDSWAMERRRNQATGQMQETLVHYLNFNMNFVFDQSRVSDRRRRQVWVRIASETGHNGALAPERGRVSEGKNVVLDNSFSVVNKLLNSGNDFNALIGQFTIVNGLVPKNIGFIEGHKALGFNTNDIDHINEMNDYYEKMVANDLMTLSDIFLLKRDSAICAKILDSRKGDWTGEANAAGEHLSYMPTLNSFQGQLYINCSDHTNMRNSRIKNGLHKTQAGRPEDAQWQLTGSAFIQDGTGRPENSAEVIVEYNDTVKAKFVTEERPSRCKNLLDRLDANGKGYIYADGDIRIHDSEDTWGVQVRLSVLNNRIMSAGSEVNLSESQQADMANAFQPAKSKVISTVDETEKMNSAIDDAVLNDQAPDTMVDADQEIEDEESKAS